MPAGLILKIDVSERLPIVVTHHETRAAGFRVLLPARQARSDRLREMPQSGFRPRPVAVQSRLAPALSTLEVLWPKVLKLKQIASSFRVVSTMTTALGSAMP